jgi:hypothetical protein
MVEAVEAVQVAQVSLEQVVVMVTADQGSAFIYLALVLLMEAAEVQEELLLA